MKTVRFSQVVTRSGQPEPHTLWSAREDDQEFQAALKQHRVMTVHRETVGTKADFGEVGFTKGAHGALLLFPKSLKSFVGKRIVGVKYELLESGAKLEARPTKAKARPAATPRKATPHRKAEIPPLKIFRPDERAPEKRAKPAARKETKSGAQLVAAIRKAMKQLSAGKAVAYQTLEAALESL